MFLLFEFGSVAFWVLVVALSIIMMVLLENAKSPGSWCTFTALLTFVVVYWLGSAATLRELCIHIEHNVLQTVVYFLIYVLVGIAWSFVEWRWFVIEQAEEYKGLIKAGYTRNMKDYMPEVSRNKSKLMTWIFYWPWSVVWFAAHKPIETLYKEILKVTTRVYNSITASAFKGLK